MADTASTNPVADGWQTVGDKTTSKLLEEGALQDGKLLDNPNLYHH